MPAAPAPAEPPADCPLCPRLVAFRQQNRMAHPDWFNGAAPSFGPATARLLVVGLAPGLQGANRTGRPFTGDYAGELLYPTMIEFGFAAGAYGARPDDGLRLVDAMITNAVRCVPPQNKPTPAEANACRPHLVARIAALPRLRAILCLGRIAHDAVLKAFDERLAAHPFGHGARHAPNARDVTVYDSYHCSRYNTNTGRLTPDMFRTVFAAIRQELDGAA
ncbi:MAG: uracil-DNA glycosylase [Alphaproteobacteria bacterium]|nr:uracil-DNA glycosylase [Alphaproteobacteria bacterium]